MAYVSVAQTFPFRLCRGVDAHGTMTRAASLFYHSPTILSTAYTTIVTILII